MTDVRVRSATRADAELLDIHVDASRIATLADTPLETVRFRLALTVG